MLKWINKKRNKKGFTLVELVVVIAILGILAAIAVPKLGGFQENAKVKADEASAATIARSVEMYNATNHPTKLAAGLLTAEGTVTALGDMVETTTTFTSTTYGGSTQSAVPYIGYDTIDTTKVIIYNAASGGVTVYPK